MDVLAYQKAFDKQRAGLKLPDDCTESEPTVEPVGFYFWTMAWFLIFDDKQYVRIWERWDKKKGLDDSRRMKFSFHYGPIVKTDSDGNPAWESADPVHIRIDNSTQPYHLHYGAQNPHYDQTRIKGLTLESLDPFRFVHAIIGHRSGKGSIQDLLGFKIV